MWPALASAERRESSDTSDWQVFATFVPQCFSATLGTIKRNDGIVFQAKK